MKKSRYNLFVPNGEVTYAINLLSRTVLSLSTNAYNFYQSIEMLTAKHHLKRWQSELLSVLRKSLFVLNDDFDELSYIKLRHTQEKYSKSVLTLSIIPSMACNMSCYYCFEKKDEKQLTLKNANGIKNFVKNIIPEFEHLHIQWFGGEPLLSENIIISLSKMLRRECRNLQRKYSAEITTNGFIFTGDVAKRLAEQGVKKAQITFEGMRSLHDHIRFAEESKGSFDILIENIKAASEHLDIVVRVHVAMYNIESVHRLIDYFAKKRMQSLVKKLYFVALFNNRPYMENEKFTPDNYCFISAADFAKVEIGLIAHANIIGFQLPDILDCHYSLCTGVRANAFIINPDASLTKCYMDAGLQAMTCGDVFRGIRQCEELDKWLEYDFTQDRECRKCTFAPLCMGGCPKQKFEYVKKNTVCTPLKYNFSERVRLQYGCK